MVKIHRLKQPNKHSGFALAPGKTTEVRGFVITNKNNFLVYVDKFTRKPWKPKKETPVKKPTVKKNAPKKSARPEVKKVTSTPKLPVTPAKNGDTEL